ncbi:RimK-like ATPgrasp N-terminal domain-containing protein [Azospirillum doebereinerae]|nr:RimK-like ATPgrasp N-terminal domain-containing protein [Azospirillum doebereinerae]MCG5239395.1 RimK-like ATPgrasp N-terminal domain-containing protein [Azospirillum doebereinerae]
MFGAIIAVERLRDCPWPLDGHRIVTLDDYADTPRAVLADAQDGARIVNLCRNGGCRPRSYECSLLAEERGHAVLPSVATLAGLTCRTLQGSALDRLSRELASLPEERPPGLNPRRSLLAAFGRTADPRLLPLAALAFDLFPCPLLDIGIDERSRRVTGVRAVTGRDTGADTGALFRNALDGWLSTRSTPSFDGAPRRRDWRFGEAPSHSRGLSRLV